MVDDEAGKRLGNREFVMRKLNEIISGIVKGVQIFFTPRRILALAFLVVLFWGTLYLLFNQNIYADVAGCYAWYAREFGRGHWHSLPIAALPVLNIFLGGLLVRCGMEAYTGQIVLSLLFYALTIFPLYGLLKRLVTPCMAAWGCVLFVATPKIIRFAGMGLLEATRDFFLVSAVYFLFRSWRGEFRWPQWVGMGVSLGLLSMARGEGPFMAGVIGIALLVRPRADYCKWRRLFRAVLLPAFSVAAVALLTMVPCLAHNYRVTGYPVLDTRAIGVIKHIPGADKIFHDRRVAPVREYAPESGTAAPEKKREARDTPGSRLQRLPNQMMRGCYEVYVVFLFAGIFALARRREWRREYTFLLVFCAVTSFFFIFFSVAYRYFIFLVPLLMLFILHGICALSDLLDKIHLKSAALLAVGVIVFLQPINALQNLTQGDGKREIAMGRFLKENRAEFLPPERVHDKLIIQTSQFPEILYRSDEARLLEYGEKVRSWERLRGFDVLIVERKEEELLEILRSRKDLREVPAPYDNYILFTPKRQETS